MLSSPNRRLDKDFEEASLHNIDVIKGHLRQFYLYSFILYTFIIFNKYIIIDNAIILYLVIYLVSEQLDFSPIILLFFFNLNCLFVSYWYFWGICSLYILWNFRFL